MRRLVAIAGIIGICLAVGMASAHAARRAVLTVEQDDLESRDVFVSRSGPDDADAHKLGRLGVLLPSYGREPLYLAFRALVLGRTALERQATETPAKNYRNDSPAPGGVPAWLVLRRTVVEVPLARAPKQYRNFEYPFFGSYLNCADGAFDLASETLKSLQGNAQLGQAALQEWVAAQDMVFDLCGDPAGDRGAPVLPKELPKSEPLHLRQLRQYQIAAADFYVGRHAEALAGFDAMAKDATHPLRVWASHAALRTLVRSASMDPSFAQRMREIRGSADSESGKRAALVAAERHYRKRMAYVYGEVGTRAKSILADRSKTSIHEAVKKLLAQAAPMIVPDQAFAETSAVLGRFDRDVERSGELAEWAELGDQLLGYERNPDLDAKLRQQHEYFDWIRTVQGCTDNPASPNFSGRCGEEHAHALVKWRRARNAPWLLASLMTAQRPGTELEPVLAAARQIKPDAVEFLTARYYQAKLLRLAGRRDEARTLIDEILPPPAYRVASNDRRKGASATNLFRQERMALARTGEEAIPYLLRDSSRGLAADGDELLNRRMATDDLLRLARSPSVDARLRSQLLVAAWWRGDLAGNVASAEAAARLLADTEPRLRDMVANYLKAGDADERHYELAKAALVYRISPLVYGYAANFLGQRRRGEVADWWCSFDSDDFSKRARVQRVPADAPELAADPAGRDAEQAALRRQGTAGDWLARVALKQTKSNDGDPYLRPMLVAASASEQQDCFSSESADLVAQTRGALLAMGQGRSPGGGAGGAGQHVARVNGRPIPNAAYLLHVANLVSKGGKEDESLRLQARDQMIRREVVAMAASAQGLGVLPDPYQVVSREAANEYLATESRLIENYIAKYLADHPVGDQEVKANYESIRKSIGGKEYRVRHILVGTEGEARSIIDALKNGGSFDDLAKRSIDAGSRDRGGDLSWATPNIYVQPFADAMVKLDKGQTTADPVRTAFGFHVIRLDDVRELVVPGLEEVRPRLIQRIQQESIARHIAELQDRAAIE